MNYLSELRAFKDWCLMNHPSTGQIALWHALMLMANSSGWQEWFPVPNQTLELLTGLSHSGVNKARQTLIDRGLIEYRPSDNRKKASKYKVNSLCKLLERRVNELENELGHELGNELENELEPQQRTSEGMLYKLNKTKTKRKQNNNNPPINPPKKKPDKKLYGEFVELTEAEYARLLADYGEQDLAWMIQRLDIYLGQNEKNRKKYTSHNHVLRGWVTDRLKEEKEKQSKVAQFKPRNNNRREEEPEFEWGYGYKPD